MQGETRSGQFVAAMVVELRRYEMELDVRAFVFGQRRAPEAAGFRDVAGCRALLEQ
jgi:hypothetical protein